MTLLFSTLTLAFANSSIRSIAAEGNTAFTTREIKAWMLSKENLPYTPNILANDIRTIVENYRRRGYLAATVQPLVAAVPGDTLRVDLLLEIDEGKRTILGSIALQGNQQFSPEEILRLFDLKVGDPLEETILESDLDILLGRYERIGFPFVQCHVENIRLHSGNETDTLDIELKIDEGSKVAIDEIRVEGNTETNPSVVVRETRIGPGEVYNRAKVNAIKARLNRLSIFSDVSDPELYVRNNTSGLLIKVKEGSTNTFDGVIGYIPGSGIDQSGYVTGLVSVSMRNLFGTGRKLSFKWAREDRFSQELGVRYLEPWILGLPANIGGGFLQRQQDTSYVRRVVDLKAELMISEELSVAGLFNSEKVIPSAGDSLFVRVFESTITSVGAELVYDTRDDAFSPVSGARYRTDYQYGRKRISRIPAILQNTIPARVTVQRFTLDMDFFLSTFSRQVLAVGIHGRELRSARPEEGEMFRLGGSRSLRGFRENQFLGSRLTWSNTEYRFLLARRSFFYGFVDAGYYFRPEEIDRLIPKAEGFRYGYGIGIQLETGIGVLAVSFAIGSDNPSFGNGKIHFGLVNDF
ncbi:MAG: BamA/TamA family outer membrane protein [Bacteroidetes bacterium]|nr:BamA/TamA family outer membrane protein [Bacteroidota bacterium]MCW5893975.1 BamA/TamA family outer membrane protein [Bacteroidota bacterium]